MSEISRRQNPARVRLIVGSVAALRVGLGVGMLAAPSLARRIAGLTAPDNGSARFVERAFAAREVALGAALLLDVVQGPPSRRALTINAATDFSDAVALIASVRGESPLRRTALIGVPTSLTVTALWLWAWRQAR